MAASECAVQKQPEQKLLRMEETLNGILKILESNQCTVEEGLYILDLVKQVIIKKNPYRYEKVNLMYKEKDGELFFTWVDQEGNLAKWL